MATTPKLSLSKPASPSQVDPVDEASAESFPASDAPSWVNTPKPAAAAPSQPAPSQPAGSDTPAHLFSGFATAALAEFGRMTAAMKTPFTPNIEALLAINRRNIETISAVNRVALEGAQAVARRNLEIMQHTMAEVTDNLRHLTVEDTPQARFAKQADMLKTAYQGAVANMQEIGGLIGKSNGEALGVLQRRFVAAIDEMKALAAKSDHPAA